MGGHRCPPVAGAGRRWYVPAVVGGRWRRREGRGGSSIASRKAGERRQLRRVGYAFVGAGGGKGGVWSVR